MVYFINIIILLFLLYIYILLYIFILYFYFLLFSFNSFYKRGVYAFFVVVAPSLSFILCSISTSKYKELRSQNEIKLHTPRAPQTVITRLPLTLPILQHYNCLIIIISIFCKSFAIFHICIFTFFII